MTTTTELHTAIYTTQTLLKQAADVIEHNAKSLAEAHTKNGIIEDLEVQAMVESDTDLVAHLRAAALPWDQRHKPAQDVPEVKFGDMAEQPAVQQERVAIARDSLAAIAQIILDGNSEDENQAQREQWAVDKIQTALSAQPAQRKPPYGWVRMNPGFNSGVFHLGTECPPGWVGGAIAVQRIKEQA